MSAPRRCGRAGYTLVEVMVALSMLAIGITGILSLENAALLSNRRAQEMTIATNIARRWQERLRRDAMQWNSPSQRRPLSDLATDTRYLCELVGCVGGGSAGGGANRWFVPRAFGSGATLESAAFDAFGNDVPVGNARTRYCAHVRLNWLLPQSAIRQGIIRAEVRVWWYREGGRRQSSYDNCGSAAALATMGSNTTDLSWVYMTSALAGNPL